MYRLEKVIFMVLVVVVLHIGNSQSLSIVDNMTKMQGVWEQQGYGVVVEIVEDDIAVYNVCSYSCIPFFEADLEDVEDEYDLQKITKDVFVLKEGITEYDFHRLEAMPDLCKDFTEEKADDVTYNFETLWHTFDEYYAYFDKRDVDWSKLKKKYQAKLSPTSSQVELYQVLAEMLDEFNDGHVYIAPSEQIAAALTDSEDEGTLSKENEEEYEELYRQAQTGITSKYIDNLKSYHFGIVKWGMIAPDMAYVQLNSMMHLANYKVDETGDQSVAQDMYKAQMEQSDNIIGDELAGCRHIMKTILADIGDAESIVIDLRFNGGGLDAVALEFLSYFVDDERVAFSKKARLGSGFTRDQYIELLPADTRFKGDIFILTSHMTASAAEIFVMASMAIPHAIRVGSNTEGIFSDILNKSLPNGIAYSISNEVYHDIEGQEYEGIGVPPHFEIEYNTDPAMYLRQLIQDLPSGDAAIEAAIRLQKMK